MLHIIHFHYYCYFQLNFETTSVVKERIVITLNIHRDYIKRSSSQII